MACLTTERRAELEARLARYQKQLAALGAAIDNGVLHVKMISFDSGEGKQLSQYRSFEEMFKAQELLESAIDRTHNLLNGTGLLTMRLSRKRRG